MSNQEDKKTSTRKVDGRRNNGAVKGVYRGQGRRSTLTHVDYPILHCLSHF